MCLFPRPLSVAEDREFDFGNERETSDVHDLAGDGWANETYGCGGFKPRFDGACINSGRYRKVYSKLRIEIAAGGCGITCRLVPRPSSHDVSKFRPNSKLVEGVAI